jgi:hypothetical protein
MVSGKQRLGRYMDPYGCQAHMQSVKQRWQRWYSGFLIGIGASLLFIEVDAFFVCLVVPVLAVWYLCKRAIIRRRYDYYYGIGAEIVRTGEPVWVPYNRQQLKALEKEPLGRWP